MKKIDEVYDWSAEQLRAQGQAIYESVVMRLLGKKHFRDPRTGRRIDTELPLDQIRELASSRLFAMGTRVGQRTGFIEEGTRRPTARAVARSLDRVNPAWADSLLRNRQDYEETLGLIRKGPFYRVVPEQTAIGVRYFVWPMPPGARFPGSATTREKAQLVASSMSATRDPRETGEYWMPPRVAYTPEQLAHWLPPIAAPGAAKRRRRAS